MADRCCITNCDNPPGGGTHLGVDVPQIGTEPMRFVGQVCEEHWFGNWHRERRQHLAEIDLLRRRLASIAALASDEQVER